jgi:hypothetical protein
MNWYLVRISVQKGNNKHKLISFHKFVQQNQNRLVQRYFLDQGWKFSSPLKYEYGKGEMDRNQERIYNKR